MPYCKNDPKKSYKGTEPSPKGLGYCAHCEKIGKIMKGLDGNKWIIVETSKGLKRWIKYSNEKTISKRAKTKSDKNNKTNKKDCSKFVIYRKKFETGFFMKTTQYDFITGLKDKEKRYVRKFISYNKFEKEYTKIPDDYHKQKISKDMINNYYCGSKKILEKDNELYPKIKKKHIGDKHYFTHWNGGKPFCIYIKNKEVYIYQVPENVIVDDSFISNNENENLWMYVNLVKKFNFKKVFIGESPKNYTDQKYSGNTILLKIKNKEYIYIDKCIYFLKYENEIIDFVSPIEVSDIPFPYAVDKDYNYLLMNQEVIFKGIKDLQDPVLFYNKYRNIIKSEKLKSKIIKCASDY